MVAQAALLSGAGALAVVHFTSDKKQHHEPATTSWKLKDYSARPASAAAAVAAAPDAAAPAAAPLK